MEKRLRLAYDLLSKNGVIFISIDDNEQARLKLLCDEIFGEENFVANMIRQTKQGGGSNSRFFAIEHDYVLCYLKNINVAEDFFMDHNELYLKRYKEEDEIGRYF
ncbi:MAG: DNA methyltransferase [Chitinophagaceae bacterium]|nr:DNA methyltransferase [Chitinophagaceae bacterium]